MLENVKKFIDDKNTSFGNWTPSNKWFTLFRRRHKEISIRNAQNLTKARSAITENSIRHWSKGVLDYCTEHNLLEVLQNPNRIFNMDESAFLMNPTQKKVLARRGARTVYNSIGNNEKQCLTVLLGGNALGLQTPPMVVFKNKIFPKAFKDHGGDVNFGVPENWAIGMFS